MEFWYLWSGFCGILLLLGIVDKQVHRHYLHRIAIRINVNGTRGKSTVTRLITGALQEAGVKVVGKTTGTAARIIFWNQEEEIPVPRKYNRPNIKEQCTVVKIAAKSGADCLVSECMAVKPEYQKIFARQLMDNNIGVIVNTLPDHLDEMGPTTREVAKALSITIPEKGLLVAPQDEFAAYYNQIADKRLCQVRVADPVQIPEAYLEQFHYLIFPQNVALALEVALALGVEREVALRGMLKAHPDPGVLTISQLSFGIKDFYFANAFAANDPVSTMLIHEKLNEMGYREYPLVVVVNCREDRVDRTKQIAKDVLPNISCTHLISIGSATQFIKNGYAKGHYKCENYWDLENLNLNNILKRFEELPDGSLIFGIGNIHGAAEDLLAFLHEQDIPQKSWVEWSERKLVHI